MGRHTQPWSSDSAPLFWYRTWRTAATWRQALRAADQHLPGYGPAPRDHRLGERASARPGPLVVAESHDESLG